MSKIVWPDLRLPPINLLNAPRIREPSVRESRRSPDQKATVRQTVDAEKMGLLLAYR